jgi:hypothetical protein
MLRVTMHLPWFGADGPTIQVEKPGRPPLTIGLVSNQK